MTSRYKIVIAYDGSRYHGWQIQPNALSIQEEIETVLFKILQSKITLTGSGRTDTNVHAIGQVAHFDAKILDTQKFITSLNALLPKDISVLSLDNVPKSFHARYSALKKIYHYHIDLNTVQEPFSRFYQYHHPQKLDLHQIRKGAKILLGTHDFQSFANKKKGCHDFIRTLFRLDILEENKKVRFEFEGDGFLYKMVRNIVGTLLDVGRGKTSLEELQHILESKDRKNASAAIPGHGLFLIQVIYPKSLSSIEENEG